MKKRHFIIVGILLISVLFVIFYNTSTETSKTNDQGGYTQAEHTLYNIPRVQIRFQYPQDMTSESIANNSVWYWRSWNDTDCNQKFEQCIKSIKMLAMWYECQKNINSDMQTKNLYQLSRFYIEDPNSYHSGNIVNVNNIEVLQSKYSDIGSATVESSVNISELSFVVAGQICFIGANKSLSDKEKETVFNSLNIIYDASMK